MEPTGFEHVYQRVVVDQCYRPEVADPWPAHRICLSANVYIIEGLTNLGSDRRASASQFSALPLAVPGSSGSPVRRGGVAELIDHVDARTENAPARAPCPSSWRDSGRANVSAMELVQATLSADRRPQSRAERAGHLPLGGGPGGGRARGSRASRVDDARRLEGIPFSVKDLIATAGVRTTAGSRVLRDYVPERSATAVQRLQDEGAILIGKSNCSEFGIGNLHTGNPCLATRGTRGPRRGHRAAPAVVRAPPSPPD